MIALTLVVLGSALGAPLRYLVDRQVQGRHERVFPWGTLVVNASGSLALGVLLGAADRWAWSPLSLDLLAVGVLGSFTTFSTYVWETLQMVDERSFAPALLNALGSIAVGMAAFTIGFWVV